jgi:hypothetical protein
MTEREGERQEGGEGWRRNSGRYTTLQSPRLPYSKGSLVTTEIDASFGHTDLLTSYYLSGFPRYLREMRFKTFRE